MRLRRALALGLLHGPAELLPVSSSAHAALLLQDVEPERRKELEVAVHTGTLAVLGLPRPSLWLALTTAPAALTGLLFERPIEQRFGTPRTLAAGLLAGGVAMALADARPTRRPRRRAVGGLAVGLAQTAALWPGVSRHGAVLTVLRARGVARPDAHAISREAARPVLLGATLLKGVRVLRRGEGLGAVAAAAAGSALSTWVARRALAGRGERMPLWPFALYRAALAASVLRMAAPNEPAAGKRTATAERLRG
jgi:undecaprenyl-diphosphatase